MVRRREQKERSTSPVPEDPFLPPFKAGFVRAEDGNPAPTPIEAELARRRPLSSPSNRRPSSPSNRRSSSPSNRRPSSPSNLPGVRPLSREFQNLVRDQLIPGPYYAKSMTQYLGPFDQEPTEDDLPSGDTFFILQDMGRYGDSGKCIFRQVRKIVMPVKEDAPLRPLSPSELPGVRYISDELDDETKNNLIPGRYYLKSMSRYLGPYDTIPSAGMVPAGDSYVVLQEMGRLPSGMLVFRRVTQIDR